MECTSPENSFQPIICHCIWNAQGKDAKSFVCTSDPTLTSVLLLFSIPLRYWRAYHFSLYCADMEVKQINKRASGQAFELILKPPSPVSEAPRTLASPKKKELSLEEIQKKLEAAEERRKVSFLKKMLVIRPDSVQNNSQVSIAITNPQWPAGTKIINMFEWTNEFIFFQQLANKPHWFWCLGSMHHKIQIALDRRPKWVQIRMLTVWVWVSDSFRASVIVAENQCNSSGVLSLRDGCAIQTATVWAARSWLLVAPMEITHKSCQRQLKCLIYVVWRHVSPE